MIVKDYISKNEDILVRLDAQESRNDCDPLFKTIWQGSLKDVPEEYQKMEVISEGWMAGAKINSISVYAPELMCQDYRKSDEETACIKRIRGR